MADDMRPGDQLGRGSNGNAQTSGTSAVDFKGSRDTNLLQSIDDKLYDILTRVDRISQSSARSSMPGSRSDANKWRPDRSSRSSSGRRSNYSSNFKDASSKFSDSFEQAMMDSIFGSDFKSKIQSKLSKVAEDLGVELEDIPDALGKALGKHITSESKIGKAVTNKVRDFVNNTIENMDSAYDQGKSSKSIWQAFRSGMKTKGAASSDAAQSAGDVVNKAKDIAGKAQDIAGNKGADIIDLVSKQKVVADGANIASTAQAAGGAAASAGAAGSAAALKGLAASAGAMAAAIGPVVIGLTVLDKFLETFSDAIEGIVGFLKTFSEVGNRASNSQKKNQELANKRMQKDVEAYMEAPFKILESAAQKLYDAWDNQIRNITATQGYRKEDVQSLMSAYARRLQSEGLMSEVSGADIMENLSKVLESGLSGTVAEEFSYLATKLEAAVPTQDFFGYASTYASIAANAIKNGESEAEAIAYANKQMETFASNVLYASRQLSGGFSTGLKDAQQLFDYSVQIANASKVGDAASISGVLTSVSAIAGAVAPDLASGIVEAVVKAATGGNASEIVALRSLAGINASNTEFLRILAQDPQAVFTSLFTNLAKMQNMSNDNFMEVAEGLSSVFGISMDSFARVDFNYLANAISEMNVNNASLDENMKLLRSSQTTTSTEQLKMAQINQYMLEEGLAYVLDNEVSRQIQQHMWDEQMNRELMEAEYAVNLKGSGLDALTGIKSTVTKIVNFLNPFSWFKKVNTAIDTAQQGEALNDDMLSLLKATVVGQQDGNLLYKLVTRNADLNLTPDYLQLFQGSSRYASAKYDYQKWHNDTMWGGYSPYGDGNWVGSTPTNSAVSGVIAEMNAKLEAEYTKKPYTRSSKYAWGTVSKSTAALLAQPYTAPTLLAATSAKSAQSNTSAEDAAKAKSNAVFEKFLSTIEQVTSLEARNSGKALDYDQWVATARAHGISDYQAALEAYGATEDAIKGMFTDGESKAAGEQKADRQKKEDEFWAQATLFAKNEQQPWKAWQDTVTGNQTTIITALSENGTTWKQLNTISTTLTAFLTSWTDYYINHTAYSESTLNSYKAADILKSEKAEQQDAILALAEALTSNQIGIQEGLKDPVVQTNVLLAKILLVAEAIMQQNNNTGGLSLPDSFAALATGTLLKM